jgi:hypothetical protein
MPGKFCQELAILERLGAENPAELSPPYQSSCAVLLLTKPVPSAFSPFEACLVQNFDSREKIYDVKES